MKSISKYDFLNTEIIDNYFTSDIDLAKVFMAKYNLKTKRKNLVNYVFKIKKFASIISIINSKAKKLVFDGKVPLAIKLSNRYFKIFKAEFELKNFAGKAFVIAGDDYSIIVQEGNMDTPIEFVFTESSDMEFILKEETDTEFTFYKKLNDYEENIITIPKLVAPNYEDAIKYLEFQQIEKNTQEILDKPIAVYEDKKAAKKANGNETVLVIADIHLPFEHKNYLSFCKNMRDKYDATKIIFIGDIIDNHYHSFHTTNPDGYSAGEELKRTKDKIAIWYSVFPEATILIGNHDLVVQRRAFDQGISREWIKGINEVFNVPNWKFKFKYEYNNITYIHGTGSSGVNSAYDRALYSGKSIVQGHLHTLASVMYVNQKTFGMIVGCVDKDTEYLTKEGWKKISTYTTNEEVAQYNIDGSISFVKPSHYIKEPVKEFNYFKTKYGISQKLSDDHDMLYISRNSKKLIKKNVKEIINKHEKSGAGFSEKLPATFKTTFDYNPYSENQWKLITAFAADGSFSNNKIIFTFKKERKITRLEMILTNLNILFSKVKYKNDTTRITIDAVPYLVKRFSEIKDIYLISNEAKQIILNECLLWDGDQKKVFYTTKKEEADIIQYFSNSIGKMATINFDDRKNKESYRVLFSNRVSTGIKSTKESKIEIKKIQSEDNFKYCFTVPSSNLVLRCEDDIFITGNCGIDSNKYAFNYAKSNKKPNIISCGIVTSDGVPIIETMK